MADARGYVVGGRESQVHREVAYRRMLMCWTSGRRAHILPIPGLSGKSDGERDADDGAGYGDTGEETMEWIVLGHPVVQEAVDGAGAVDPSGAVETVNDAGFGVLAGGETQSEQLVEECPHVIVPAGQCFFHQVSSG